MKKLLSTIAVAAVAAGIAAPASATEGWYGRVDAGYSTGGEIEFSDGGSAQYDLENDWMAAAGIGYAFQNNFRVEGEYAYRNNGLEDTDGELELTAHSLFLNGYYDFNRGGRFEPYVGLGVGYVDPEDIDDSGVELDSGWGYQALVGVAIGITERLDLDVGYRYLVADDIDATEGATEATMSYEHQAVTLGLRWQFGA
ncbi:MAG: outer membrane beta-barrel protein, partial [Hyphomonadaceae bacterium]|nr:outer membrane beta-barrel protein [Hyphomonadaceae bacterium]